MACWRSPAWPHSTTVAHDRFSSTACLNGGIGKSEADLMHRVAKKFPLCIVFSERKDVQFHCKGKPKA